MLLVQGLRDFVSQHQTARVEGSMKGAGVPTTGLAGLGLLLSGRAPG